MECHFHRPADEARGKAFPQNGQNKKTRIAKKNHKGTNSLGLVLSRSFGPTIPFGLCSRRNGKYCRLRPVVGGMGTAEHDRRNPAFLI